LAAINPARRRFSRHGATLVGAEEAIDVHYCCVTNGRIEGLNALTYIRGMLNDMLDDLDDGQMLHQPTPGCNHALWIIGHLALCDDQYRSRMGGGPGRTPEDWAELFGFGSQPLPHATDYPPIAQVRTALADCRRDLLHWLGGKDAAALQEELPTRWRAFAPTYAALPASVAAHEALHVGQLTVVRKSLGVIPVTI
jgi:hypothetical protein